MFKVHKDAKNWAENLFAKDSPVKTLMDVYYLSLMVGIGRGDCPSFEESRVIQITRTYTGGFLPYKDLLAGVLLVAEINNYGLPMERDTIRKKVFELFDSKSQTSLSEQGINIMNRYAFGGFELMKSKLKKAPAVHDFLIWYKNNLLEECFLPKSW